MKTISVYPLKEKKNNDKLQQEKLDRLNEISLVGLDLCEKLSHMDFWCGDDTLHKRNPDYQHTAECCVTHIVGLPRHPATNEEMPLTPYQLDMVYKILKNKYDIIHDKKVAKELLSDILRQYFFYHLNKGRQMGFTEIMLRLIQFLSFSLYAGYNVGIMAATNGNLARKDLRRFARLFLNIKPVVSQWIKSGVMKLVNGTVIEAFSASEEAITGDTKYKCILMDEAAKWRLIDDLPVFNSVEPIIRASGGDLFLISTPKRPVKMFFKITKTENEYIRLQYDIWNTEGNLYTKQQIEQMLASATGDPNQEYLCVFSIGEDSIFGIVGKEDMKGKPEWGYSSYNSSTTNITHPDEDDNFVESEDDDNDDNSEITWHET